MLIKLYTVNSQGKGCEMMSIVVIYKTKYGATQKYAEWIADALGADCFNIRKFNKEQFAQYDTVILGGGIYAGNINGISLISKNFAQLVDKHLIIFTVGIKDPGQPRNAEEIEKGLLKVLTPDMLEHIKVFSFRGALDCDKVNVLHYSMLKILAQVTDDLTTPDVDEGRIFQEAFEKPQNFIEYDQIKPLVNYVKTMAYIKEQR